MQLRIQSSHGRANKDKEHPEDLRHKGIPPPVQLIVAWVIAAKSRICQAKHTKKISFYKGRVKGGQTLNAAEKQNKAPGISKDLEQQEDLEAQAHQEDKTKI